MTLLMENAHAKIGCGDPGDPIEFSAFFTGANYVSRPVTATNRREAVFDYLFKNVGNNQYGQLHIATVLGSNGNYFLAGLNSSSQYVVQNLPNSGGGFSVASVGRLRDQGDHYHPHVRINTSALISTDRVQLWVGGVRMLLTGTFPTQNYDMPHLGGNETHYIGSWYGSPASPGSGDDAIVSRMVYSSSLVPQLTDFGRFNSDGHWVVKAYSGPADYHLPFSDQGNMGLNLAGDDFVVGGSVEQTVDTPGWGNYATLDPNYIDNTDVVVLSEGNLVQTGTPSANGCVSTLPILSKLFFSMEILADGNTNYRIGVRASDNLVYVYTETGDISLAGVVVGSGDALSVGDHAACSYDPDSGELEFFKLVGGEWLSQGAVIISVGSSQIARAYFYTSSGTQIRVNFGQKAFPATVPNDCKLLRSSDLPCPDILNPEDYFVTRKEIGGADITGLSFDPTAEKVLFVSKRLDTTGTWRFADTVGGISKYWAPDPVSGSVENTDANGLQAFTPDGAQIGSSADYQGTRRDFVWRASPAAGFDIVEVNHTQGTDTTVSQNTGGAIDYALAPNMDGGDVRVYHRSLPSGGFVLLNKQSNAGTDAGWLTSTANTVTLGASMPSGRYRLYLWRAIRQFSAFFSWLGTANDNGPLSMLDFKARAVSYVGTSTSGGGVPYSIHAASNENGNPSTNYLWMDDNTGEKTSGEAIDIYSTGVKQRIASGRGNWLGIQFLGAAWAQTPAKFLNAG